LTPQKQPRASLRDEGWGEGWPPGATRGANQLTVDMLVDPGILRALLPPPGPRLWALVLGLPA